MEFTPMRQEGTFWSNGNTLYLDLVLGLYLVLT